MRRQVPTLVQAIVDRFYPERLGALSAPEAFTTHAVLEGSDDNPGMVLATYTNRAAGAVRVLARSAAGTWDVASESPEFLLLPGGRCGIRLVDLDFDGRPEALISFQATRAITTWVFRWDGSRLISLTPTQLARDGEVSQLLSAFTWDLDHMGPLRIIAERVVERPGPGQRPRNPAFVYRLGPDGYEVENTVVAVMGFRADVDARSNLRPFRLIQDSEPPFTMRVINGERGGRSRVTGATIFINNRSVLDQRDVNAMTEFSSVPLPALLTENHLTASLTGPPEGRIIVLIEDSTQR